MLLTGMGWGTLVPKTSEKKPGVGTKPILAGPARLWARLSPSPALCDWDFVQQSLVPALVMASGTFLTPCTALLTAGSGRAHKGPRFAALVAVPKWAIVFMQ